MYFHWKFMIFSGWNKFLVLRIQYKNHDIRYSVHKLESLRMHESTRPAELMFIRMIFISMTSCVYTRTDSVKKLVTQFTMYIHGIVWYAFGKVQWLYSRKTHQMSINNLVTNLYYYWFICFAVYMVTIRYYCSTISYVNENLHG